jgi:hypothetical protein
MIARFGGEETKRDAIWRGSDDAARENCARRRKRGDARGRATGAADPQDATQVFPMAFL